MAEQSRVPHWFHADPFLIEHIAPQLGPNGPGFAHLGPLVDYEYLDAINAELSNPANVTWRDNRSIKPNKRGVDIHENYDAYSLKLSHGDQEPVNRIPLTMALTRSIENLVRYDLAAHYPALSNWFADEAVMHDYDPDVIGITPHYDFTRYWGLIMLTTLSGEGTFTVVTKDGEQFVRVKAGDVLAMRGPGLYETAEGEDIRPLHGANGERRVLQVRANTQPDKHFKDFIYDNWPADN